MRTEIVIALAIVIIVSLCLWTNRTLLSSYEIMQKHSKTVYNATQNEHWSEAERALTALSDYLSRIHPTWSIIVSHSILEEIEVLIAQLRTEIREHSRLDALTTISALQLRLDFIARDEMVKLKNIF